MALCPFHKENTPSFTVNPQRQIYHCFGCHAHGDVFKFLQEYEHIEFIEAVKRLAERAGIPLEFEENPQADAVLVQRHGVYVWGKDWRQAKAQAECLDYLFRFVDRMARLGLSPVGHP